MNWPSKEEIKKIREKYPKGTIIKIIKMDDPTPVPPGTLGVVESIDDIGNIHCNFLNYNSSLAIVPCKDEFIVVPKNEVFQRVHEVLTKQIKYQAYGTPAMGVNRLMMLLNKQY